MEDQITLVIVDDHPLIRKGLRDVISLEEELTILDEAGDGAQAMKSLEKYRPDVVILDLEIPVMNGIDVIRKMKEEEIPSRIVVLTAHAEEQLFKRVMKLGVQGYMLKDSALDEVVKCISNVHQGEYFVSPVLAGYAFGRKPENTLHGPRTDLSHLTKSELKIIRLIAENHTTGEIAEELSISPKTVTRHRENITTKLDLHGNYALLRFALEHRTQLSEPIL